MNLLARHIAGIERLLPPALAALAPWALAGDAAAHVEALAAALGEGWQRRGALWVHETATVEAGVVVHGPAVVGPRAFVAAHAYFRDGVFLGEGVRVGPSCELKASFVFDGSALAHLNYVGNSVIGRGVNVEGGAVLANHWNERADQAVHVRVDGQRVATGVTKFGALVGDGARIGANAVTSPGTLLAPGQVVGRLALVDQDAAGP